ncbi:MAG TPA: hypothetical protein DEF45_21065 [Rhodopirellula sp.]|nr:hypothetical protein [Rhodopirellula sp.]
MARYGTPGHLRFPHHTLSPDELRGEVSQVPADHAVAEFEPNSSGFAPVVQQLRDANVRHILLIHGTFAGGDITGFVREVKRFSPVRASRMDEISKAWFDELAGDVGNFTDAYAKQLSGLINTEDSPMIKVERFGWSGENHHIGRADGAVSLLRKITSMDAKGRLLVMAHSHGGSLLAMLSQIAAASHEVKEAFFKATRLHYHSPLRSKVDLEDWVHAREILLDGHKTKREIDVATFGAPLRYRWNEHVVPRLLHFTQHRPSDGDDPLKAVIPRSVSDLISAASGDYIQHLAIAGTDFFPSFFAWRDVVVERRLRKMFESTGRRRDIFQKLKYGRRESSDGRTLLVDYPETPGREQQKLFGHGVYTSPAWLQFHLETICEHFYSRVVNFTD